MSLIRITELCRSIDALIEATPGLERVVRADDAPAGCSARFTSTRGATALLDVSVDAVTVTTHSAGAHANAGDSETLDRLDVRLADGFVWDDVDCASANELARLLFKHMLRRSGQAPLDPAT